MQKQRILFVDDDPMVLRALTRQLRAHTDRWDVDFVGGGHAAMQFLAERPVDVLVTDMGMPGVDGSQLLHHVRERYPGIVRIVLSAHSNFEQVVRSVPFAHQRFCKPWEPDALIAMLIRATQMRAIVGEENVRRTVSEVGALPSSPQLYMQLSQALESPNATFSTISAIIANDMAMSAKVLQLANSAFVGARRAITEIDEAVRMIGLSEIRTYAMSPFLNVFSVYGGKVNATGGVFARLGEHAHLTGRLAAQLAREVAALDAAAAARAYVAGLLHDIGELVLLDRLPDDHAAIMKEAEEKQCSMADVERRRLGVTHAEIGAYLLSLWGLPPDVCNAAMFHHTAEGNRSGEDAAFVDVVWTANWLASELEARKRAGLPGADVLALDVDLSPLERLGFHKRIDALLRMAEMHAPQAKALVR